MKFVTIIYLFVCCRRKERAKLERGRPGMEANEAEIINKAIRPARTEELPLNPVIKTKRFTILVSFFFFLLFFI